jgi:hypothetical protein
MNRSTHLFRDILQHISRQIGIRRQGREKIIDFRHIYSPFEAVALLFALPHGNAMLSEVNVTNL